MVRNKVKSRKGPQFSKCIYSTKSLEYFNRCIFIQKCVCSKRVNKLHNNMNQLKLVSLNLVVNCKYPFNLKQEIIVYFFPDWASKCFFLCSFGNRKSNRNRTFRWGCPSLFLSFQISKIKSQLHQYKTRWRQRYFK